MHDCDRHPDWNPYPDRLGGLGVRKAAQNRMDSVTTHHGLLLVTRTLTAAQSASGRLLRGLGKLGGAGQVN